jgi:hypothetical protein
VANLDRRRFVLLDRTRKRYLDLASLWEVSIWQARQSSAQQVEPLFDGIALGRTLRALRAATAAIEPHADQRLQEWARRWAATQGIPTGRELFVRALLDPRFVRDCRSLIAWRRAEARGESEQTLAALRQNPDFLQRFGLQPPNTSAPPRAPRAVRPWRRAPHVVEARLAAPRREHA